MSYILGVDPGKSGCLAWVSLDATEYGVAKMPETEKDLWDRLGELRARCGAVFIEEVHSSPQMGVSSAFTFGRGYGALRVALIGHAFVVNGVTPQAWKRALRCTTAKQTFGKSTKKDMTVVRARAQELFPNIRITDWNCEGLLIAEYGRRQILGFGSPTPTERGATP